MQTCSMLKTPAVSTSVPRIKYLCLKTLDVSPLWVFWNCANFPRKISLYQKIPIKVSQVLISKTFFKRLGFVLFGIVRLLSKLVLQVG